MNINMTKFNIKKKILKIFRSIKSPLIIFLIIFNIMLAKHTVPMLLESLADHGEAQNSPRFSAHGGIGHEMKVNISMSFNNGNDNDWESFLHEYFYVTQPKMACEEDDQFLLIVVCSAPHHFNLRSAIRNTWGSVVHKHRLAAKLVFMLGVPSGEYAYIQPNIMKESESFGDLIQEDFVDSYVNLTIKSVGVLKWAVEFCPGVKYVMKTDDDVFVNVPSVITELVDMSTRRSMPQGFLLGNVIENAKPVTDRNSKWFAPIALYKEQVYPSYLSGSAYVISGNIIEELYGAATMRKPFWLEDIFLTGMLAKDMEVPLIHNAKFTYRKPGLPHPCFYKSILSAHELSSLNLLEIWKDMHTSNVDCTLYRGKYIL